MPGRSSSVDSASEGGEVRNILALDLGTTTGWAMNTEAGYKWGHFDVKPTADDSWGMRWVYFRRELSGLFTLPVDLVVYETNHFTRGKSAVRVMAGLVAHLQEFCLSLPEPVQYHGVPVVTIKSHATGKGNAGKVDMVKQATKLTGFILTEDEADAICLLDLAVMKWGK